MGGSAAPSRSYTLAHSTSSNRFDYTPPSSGGLRSDRAGSPFSREFAKTGLFAPSPSSGIRRSSANDTSQLVRQKRVARDDETSNLLELYGARKSSNPGESSAASYLKARKLSQQQATLQNQSAFDADGLGAYGASNRQKSLEDNPFGVRGYAGGFYDTPSTSSGSRNQQKSTDQQAITADEYMQRLMAAHNRVDELLKSRGLTADDEKKYLKAWEEIPIIRQERIRRLRTPSVSSSDSGLSTDNDSDRSGADKTQQEDNQEPEVSEPQPEIELPEDTIGLLQEIKKKEKKAKCCMIVKLDGDYESAEFSCKAASFIEVTSNVSANTRTRPKPHLLRQNAIASSSIDVPIKGMKKYASILNCKETKFAEKSCANTIANRVQSVEVVNHYVTQRNKGEDVSAKVKEPHHEEIRRNLILRRRVKEDSAVEQQKEMLASLKPKREVAPPSSAEISIQHCSFYQVTAQTSAVPPNKVVEKHVRINLRLTERAPKNCVAVISLPSPPRTVYARLDINLNPPKECSKTKSLKRSKTIEYKQAPKVGKLDRSKTLCLNRQDMEKQLRQVNKLQIPEYFLQQQASEKEDFKSIKSNLKRVTPPIVGGFLVAPKPKEQNQRQSHLLNRVNAIRRRLPPSKAKTTELRQKNAANDYHPPYSDFIMSQPVPEVRIHEPKEPPPSNIKREPPDRRSRSISPHRLSPVLGHLSCMAPSDPLVPPPPSAAARRAGRQAINAQPANLANYLNLPGSLERSATSSGAAKAKKTLYIAELSEVDRVLIEQYRRTLNIPKPQQARINPIMPYFHKLRILIPKPLRNAPPPPPKATFVRKKEPKQFSPPPCEPSLDLPKLAPASPKKATIKKGRWFELSFNLKKIDWKKHAARKKPRVKKHAWKPRWRKRHR